MSEILYIYTPRTLYFHLLGSRFVLLSVCQNSWSASIEKVLLFVVFRGHPRYIPGFPRLVQMRRKVTAVRDIPKCKHRYLSYFITIYPGKVEQETHRLFFEDFWHAAIKKVLLLLKSRRVVMVF